MLTKIASASGILGAILIALNINQFILGYCFFALSALLWSFYAYKTQNKELLYMNEVFLLINLLGLYRFSNV